MIKSIGLVLVGLLCMGSGSVRATEPAKAAPASVCDEGHPSDCLVITPLKFKNNEVAVQIVKELLASLQDLIDSKGLDTRTELSTIEVLKGDIETKNTSIKGHTKRWGDLYQPVLNKLREISVLMEDKAVQKTLNRVLFTKNGIDKIGYRIKQVEFEMEQRLAK